MKVDVHNDSASGDATVQQVLEMTTALDYTEDYSDPMAGVWTYAQAGSPLPSSAIPYSLLSRFPSAPSLWFSLNNMNSRPRTATFRWYAILVVIFLFCLATDLFAQSRQGSDQDTAVASIAMDDPEISFQAIDDWATQVAANSSLNDDQKADLKQRLERAKQALTNAETLATKTAELRNQSAADIAERIKTTKSELEQTPPQTLDSMEVLSSDQLTSQIADIETQLAAATKQAQELTVEPTRRQTRLNEIPDQLTKANDELENIRKQRAQADAPNESEIESQSRKLWLTAREKELQQTAEMLKQERASYTSMVELLPLQQQLADKTVSQLRVTVEALKQAQTERKREQATDAIRATQRLVDQVPDTLKQLARSNVELANLQRQLVTESAKATIDVTEIETMKDLVAKELAKSIKRVEAVGLTDALGAMFRERRDEFQELANRFQPDLAIREKIEAYQTKSFRLEDDIKNLDIELAKLSVPKVDWESDSIRWQSLSESDAKWVLLKKRRKLVGETLRSQGSLLQSVFDSDTRRRELSTAVEKYHDFVNRRLFWTRSAPLFSADELKHLPASTAWMANQANWKTSLQAIGRSFKIAPLRSSLVSLFAIGLWAWRSRVRRFIIHQGQLAARVDSTFRPTSLTMLASIVAASPWPVVLAAIAYLLSCGAEDRIAQVAGSAFGFAAIFVASRELLREICRNEGLADAHLGWSLEIRRHLRFHLHWYTLLGATCVCLMVMMNAHPENDVRMFGIRLPATMLFLVIGMFHHVVFKRNSPLYADIVRANPDSFIYRRRKLVWSILVLLPLSFSVLALAGYLDTVLRLGRLVQFTLLWLLAVLLMLALVYRWISIHRRDVARRQVSEARRKRLAEAGGGIAESELPATETSDELAMADLPALDLKTRKTAWVLAMFLAMIGLVVIWKDIFPAIEYFGDTTLWKVAMGDTIESVSLLDLLISGLVIFGLVFTARSIVSLLELVVLSRTSLDSGSRYAMSMILQYVLFIIGAIVVVNLLSIPVQQLGWLLAAVSVGIGFGLQEIIANFVCGIILLLERPVRVGDVVSIGDTTGSVSKIQMRATTVTNWDRKELVIPNKDLITGKVLNWSLSNVVNRMTLAVGVQRGVDPDTVRDLLKNVVTNHPGILRDPAPAINLESFGDSTLNFLVRFYLPNLDNRISFTHEVNTAIARALSQADIEIPVPQRNVNLSIVSDQEPIVIANRNAQDDGA